MLNTALLPGETDLVPRMKSCRMIVEIRSDLRCAGARAKCNDECSLLERLFERVVLPEGKLTRACQYSFISVAANEVEG